MRIIEPLPDVTVQHFKRTQAELNQRPQNILRLKKEKQEEKKKKKKEEEKVRR